MVEVHLPHPMHTLELSQEGRRLLQVTLASLCLRKRHVDQVVKRPSTKQSHHRHRPVIYRQLRFRLRAAVTKCCAAASSKPHLTKTNIKIRSSRGVKPQCRCIAQSLRWAERSCFWQWTASIARDGGQKKLKNASVIVGKPRMSHVHVYNKALVSCGDPQSLWKHVSKRCALSARVSLRVCLRPCMSLARCLRITTLHVQRMNRTFKTGTSLRSQRHCK